MVLEKLDNHLQTCWHYTHNLKPFLHNEQKSKEDGNRASSICADLKVG